MNMKNEKILILISRIVAFLNAFWCSAAQLPQLSWAAQNSILPLPARNYSTLATPRSCSVENFKLDPNWVTGFIDGEGCFTVPITLRKDRKFGWQVCPHFQIILHVKDNALLKEVKKFFNVGKISKSGPELILLRVQSLKELETVINHFQKFPLITKKRADYKLFKMVIITIKRKEHLTYEGLRNYAHPNRLSRENLIRYLGWKQSDKSDGRNVDLHVNLGKLSPRIILWIGS